MDILPLQSATITLLISIHLILTSVIGYLVFLSYWTENLIYLLVLNTGLALIIAGTQLFLLLPSSSISSFSSSSLLEFQGPDVLRPACPAFGFLVVAAHCAFQDFVLDRGEARGRKVEREIQRGDLVPHQPRAPWAQRDSETEEEMGSKMVLSRSPCTRATETGAALATTLATALATAQAAKRLQYSTTESARL